MRKDLNKKLISRYPLLYKDYLELSVGTGWYKLINSLSYILEGLIKQWIKDNPDAECECGEPRSWHENETGKCLYVYKIPFQLKAGNFWSYPTKERWTRKWMWRRFCKWINKRLSKFCDWNLLYHKELSNCKKFKVNHPKVFQVKEKWGGLRFYLNGGTEEMQAAINKAEKESLQICEICGMPGRIRNNGWTVTLCDRCNKTNHH